MLQHELRRDRGILILRPDGPLRADDFTAIAALVDPYLDQHGELNGLVVDVPSFPGWDDFAALASHLRFVRDHHRRIKRIAVVSDSTLLSIGPKIANHFVSAQVQAFASEERAAALAWAERG